MPKPVALVVEPVYEPDEDRQLAALRVVLAIAKRRKATARRKTA